MVVLNYLNEIWKDIPDFEGYYQASNYGRIKSLNYNHTGKEGILKPGSCKGGYLFVVLCINGKQKTYRVHRLIWSAFYGAIPEGYEVNHIDEDKTNNRLENLELVTHKENCNYGTRINRVTKAKSKSVFQYTLENELIKKWSSTREIERELGYCQSDISRCCRGKFKQSHGFIWKYF